jgi:NAD(P)-dependent dehydrogenase (short-subunit alcohol dehydrogenase family)
MGVVVITGCSTGFGYHASVAFGRRGDRVYASMRNPAKGDLAKVVSDEGLDVEVLGLDVDDDASVRHALGRVLEREGHIDVLVNNAGIGGTSAAIEELGDAEWMSVLTTNLLGPIRCARAVIPSMRVRGHGTIVNVSSTAGRMYGMPITAAYSASKHALCSVSDSLWAELEGFGITVACLEPGFFATSVLDNAVIPDAAGSPYEATRHAVEAFYRTSMDSAPGPDAVVAAILAAADGMLPTDAIHHPVGEDAALFIGGMSSMSYADYHEVGRQLLGLG